MKISISGLGSVTALGSGVSSFLSGLRSGVSGLSHESGYKIGRVKLKSLLKNRACAMAIDAAKEAWLDSKINRDSGLRSALFLATEHHDFNSKIFLNQEERTYKNWDRLEKVADHITSDLSLSDPPQIFLSACAAGVHALNRAVSYISTGELDVALVGGVNSCLHAAGYAAYSSIGAMGGLDSCPFSAKRDGFLMGEGASFMVVERLSGSQLRKANVYALVSGTGMSIDAHSIYDPHPTLEPAHMAIQGAFKSAHLRPEDIDIINAHATGTVVNDNMEFELFRKIFGERLSRIPIQATKSFIGHLLAASASAELVSLCLSLRYQEAYSIAGLNEVDSQFRSLLFPQEKLSMRINHGLKTAYGFGGQNGAVILSAYNDLA